METVYRDYSPKGVQFFYIYKALAHPELDGYVQPFTLKERLMHVKEAERKLGSKIPWICDSMSNDLKHALGNAPNSEFVIDPNGRIVRLRSWSSPDQLRKDLAELIGPIEKPTRISDLDLQTMPQPQPVARGVVPKVQVPGRMQPVRVEPISSESPFYVKLRAEVENDVLRTGNGKIYLGFHLDPIYRVHWNNLVDPLHYEIKTTGNTTVTPASGEGPKVKENSDVDPREFIVEASKANSKKPIELTVRYFACSDQWCKPVTQKYLVHLERDRDAGVVRGRDAPPGRGAAFGGGPGGGFDPVGRALGGLNISAEQRTKVDPIRTEYQRKARELFQQVWDGKLPRPAMRFERLKLNEALLENLKGVLNEDQFKQLDQAIGRLGPGARGFPRRDPGGP